MNDRPNEDRPLERLGATASEAADALGELARVMEEASETRPQARPTVVCLCGSSRFVDVFATTAWELEKRGVITLSIHMLPSWYGAAPDHQAEVEGVAEELDCLHLRKIDLADEVLVVDVDGYYGDSTEREIEYAREHDVPVRFLSEEDDLREEALAGRGPARIGEETP